MRSTCIYDRRKRRRIFHINMLRGWNVPKATGYWSDEVTNDPSDDIPAWREEVPESEAESPTINEELSRAQRQETATIPVTTCLPRYSSEGTNGYVTRGYNRSINQ